MIKTCQHCGAVHSEPNERCSFCDTLFEDGAPLELRSGARAFSRDNMTPTDGSLAMQPATTLRPYHEEWRQEVRERLRAYRVQRGMPVDDLQTTLPFEPEAPEEPEEEVEQFSAPAISTVAARTPASVPIQAVLPMMAEAPAKSDDEDRVEIAVMRREDASFGVYDPPGAERSSKLDAVLPVAPLSERRRAGAIDGVLILFSFGAMLSIFWVLGGRLGWNEVDGIVTGITLGLFYAQYFALFTVFGASTPGMILRRLHVVSFDGNTPTSRQMLWRSFGYLISAGTCLLGFLWALWDDDHLCWHDRISQTYITAAEELDVAARFPGIEL